MSVSVQPYEPIGAEQVRSYLRDQKVRAGRIVCSESKEVPGDQIIQIQIISMGINFNPHTFSPSQLEDCLKPLFPEWIYIIGISYVGMVWSIRISFSPKRWRATFGSGQ